MSPGLLILWATGYTIDMRAFPASNGEGESHYLRLIRLQSLYEIPVRPTAFLTLPLQEPCHLTESTRRVAAFCSPPC
eukprot:42952-Eustigmatos_ZCMA.PRE.1